MFIAACIMLAILIAINYIIKSIEDEYYIFTKVYSRTIAIISLILCIIITNLIPSKKEAIVILAGGKTMDFVQSDSSLSKIPHQATTIISSYLDKTIKEIKRENNKKDKDEE